MKACRSSHLPVRNPSYLYMSKTNNVIIITSYVNVRRGIWTLTHLFQLRGESLSFLEVRETLLLI